MALLDERLSAFPRVDLLGGVTPIQQLVGLSEAVGREIFVKRDDTAPLALAFGGNKLRKLEYLAADALRTGADTLVTAGAIQSNHVRQTAAIAAHLGMRCEAVLTVPPGLAKIDHFASGNRFLMNLLGVTCEFSQSLDSIDVQLEGLAARLKSVGRRPYVVPVGGSSPVGVMGYLRGGIELGKQVAAMGIDLSAVVLASGSGGTHCGIAMSLAQCLPSTQVVGITVSCGVQEQTRKVSDLAVRTGGLLGMSELGAPRIELWDDYFAPGYGQCSADGIEAVRLVARTEGMLLDPVYTGKAMAGLLDGIERARFANDGPILFLHTGGAPALFAYQGDILPAAA